MKIASLLLLGSLFLLPLGAHAQWQWVDKDNKKVYSDQAPPPDVPEKNILRRPASASKRLAVTPPPAVEGAAGDPAAAAVQPRAAAGGTKPAGVDKDLEEKTRKAEDAEKAKQAAEAQKLAQAKADNCNRARQSKATIDSGLRMAQLNAKGEREIMDDAARASEQKRLQGVIESDCK